MKSHAAILAISGACLTAVAWLFATEWTPRGSDGSTKPTDHAVPCEGPTIAGGPEPSDIVIDRPELGEPLERNERDGGVLSTPAADAGASAPTNADQAYLLGVLSERLASGRARERALEAEVEMLRLAIDECRNGTGSVIGTAVALPEWRELDKAQRITVTAFLERFPIHLQPGEARLIATHRSPTGDTTRELITMLGIGRVRDAIPPETRERMQRDDPDEWLEFFGVAR